MLNATAATPFNCTHLLKGANFDPVDGDGNGTWEGWPTTAKRMTYNYNDGLKSNAYSNNVAEVLFNVHCADWSCTAISSKAGKEGVAVLYGNDCYTSAPLRNNRNAESACNESTIENIHVTDGTITFKVSVLESGANWISADIKKLVFLGDDKITIPNNSAANTGYTTYSNNSMNITFEETGENLKAYRAGIANENELRFYSISHLPKGQGALIYGEAGDYYVKRLPTAVQEEDNELYAADGNTHEGCYALSWVPNNSNYPVGFYKLNSTVVVPDGKAYLQISGVSNTKAFALQDSMLENDEITAIRLIEEEKSEDTNSGTNETYSLTGMKVNTNYKGIVIRGGKKYLQK